MTLGVLNLELNILNQRLSKLLDLQTASEVNSTVRCARMLGARLRQRNWEGDNTMGQSLKFLPQFPDSCFGDYVGCL